MITLVYATLFNQHHPKQKNKNKTRAMKIGNRQPLKITNFPFQKRDIENTIEPLIHVIDPREISNSF